jgi:hypothetical protein
MSTIKISTDVWKQIRADLQTQHPKTVFMLRDKMKQVLGFTVREHKEWIPKPDGGYTDFVICLDFYNERKYTMFLLKYSEFLKENK